MKTALLLFVTILLTLNANSQCQLTSSGTPEMVTCNGDCDGSIAYMYENLNPGSPGSPYIVTLQDSQGNTISSNTYTNENETILFSDLCADLYTIFVQGNPCSDLTTVNITEPDPLLANANTTDPTFGNNDGEVEIITNGGTPPYTYSIDNGSNFQSSNIFTGLPSGNYSVIIEDDNGCQQTVTFNLVDNTQCSLVLTSAPSAVSCYGYCDGQIDYFYQTGNPNPPYQVELIENGTVQQTITSNDPFGQGVFTDLCAGIYEVIVTDAQGCTYPNTISITEPPLLMVTNVSTTDATAGNSDGSATINVTGGTPSYMYSLNGGSFQSSNTFNGLEAGAYVVLVIDANGCPSNYTFIIQETPGCFFNLSANISNPISCYYDCDASIDYIFVGDANDPPFSIVLESNGNLIQSTTNPNQTVTGTFSGLCAGQYTITVMNSSGCSEVVTVTIENPDPITVIPSTIDATPGSNDGEIGVNVSGGTAPYQYSIDNQNSWQSSPTFTGVGTGPYIVYVQDANGCIAFITVYVYESEGCEFFLTQNSLPTSCYEDCDGSIIYSFNDPGNNPDYLIELWQGNTVLDNTIVSGTNGGSGQFDNLCEGTYSIIITDVNGCSDTISSYVDSPDPLQIDSVDVIDATAGNNDGSAEVNVTGGTAPYQYSIDVGSNWQASNEFTGLAPGHYNVIVEDANGCTAVLCFTVNEDPGCTITTTLLETQQISCYAACDGILTYSYSDNDNNAPYTITLSENGNTVSTTTSSLSSSSGTFENLCAGNYSVTVSNANGCTSFASNYTLTQPDMLNVSVNVTDASTGNSNGTATVIVSGGTGQYSYSLDGVNFQTSNYFDSLSAGTYIAYVQDANGCSEIYTFLTSENTQCNITLTLSPDQMVSCPGACNGVISFFFNDVNMNPPYTVFLTNANQPGNVVTQIFNSGNSGSGTFTNVCSGIYIVSVQDENGCESFNTIQITEPPYFNISASQVNPNIGNNDGSVTINTTGGAGSYEYSIDQQSTWQTSNEFNNLGDGFYSFDVKDANSCSQVFCVVLKEDNDASLEEFSNNFSVYPNPATDQVTIEGEQPIDNIQIIDLNGRIVYSNKSNDNAININTTLWSKGVYVVRVQIANGTFHTKIVRQ